MARNGEFHRLTVELDEQTSEYIRMEAAKSKVSMSDMVRTWIKNEKNGRAKEEKKAKRKGTPQEQYLQELEDRWGLWSCAKAVGVSRGEVKAWLNDPEFATNVSDAQSEYIEKREQVLINMADGTCFGQFNAAIAFLNAHHPQYGRVKGEFLNKFIAPLLNSIQKILAELTNEDTAARVMEALRNDAECRIAQFTV